MRSGGTQAGQASVEVVALLPVIATVIAALLQAVIVGQAVWLAQSAAGAAARAAAIGSQPEPAARRALPGFLEHGLHVAPARDGSISVRVRIPALTGGALTSVTGSAQMRPQR